MPRTEARNRAYGRKPDEDGGRTSDQRACCQQQADASREPQPQPERAAFLLPQAVTLQREVRVHPGGQAHS